jgi:LuxR family maltose regulon positive regulatory protein
MLNEGLHPSRKLILVSAPAGYGKTTLVTEWLGGVSVNTAWLSLDEADNDPTRFLAYLITALENANKQINLESVRVVLQSAQPLFPEVVLTHIINAIVALPDSVILVLDDYHIIHTPAIHQQITFLLEHQPAQMHLVLVSREDPLLPIARLRARGEVVEVRQQELRFTFQECADFLQLVMGMRLGVGDISALERRTEGWIVGLQLAALSMQGRGDLTGFIQAFTGSNRFILDYLIEEVFERQTDEVKDFLLKTSILENLTASLCEAVAGNSTSQELLGNLEQANLFIVPLDQSRSWYRYHHLFSELLRHRLGASHSNLESELHQRASRWFESEGMLTEAIQHALAAQDWERAARLIDSACAGFLKRGEVLTVVGWFQSLPEAMLLSNPKLCFDYCWPLLLAGQYEKAAPLLEGVEQAAKDIPVFLGEVYAAQAFLARGVGNHERMIECSQRALELLPKNSVNSRSIVALNLGLAYWHMGKMSETEAVLVEALEAAYTTGNHYAALTALIFLGRVFAVRGQLHQAEEYFKSAIRQGKEMPINALAYMDLAALYYEWNMLAVSDEHLQKAIILSQRSLNDEFLVGCWILGSRLRIAQGDFVGAKDVLEQAWALVRAGKIPVKMIDRVNAAQAYLLLQKGEPPGEWGQKLSGEVDCHPFYRFLGVTKARLLPDVQAKAYLEWAGQTAQAKEWGYGLVAVRALQAALAETQEDALEYITEAVQLAEGGGFIRSFVEVGAKLVRLLRVVIRHGLLPEYVGRILAVMAEDADIQRSGSMPLIESLSERELEVLRLVILGLSNREIAEELIISPGTAKTHIHNVCGKLGVRNRTEAAIRAKELNLV